MLFVIDKPQFQRVMAIVRDDRTKNSRGQAGPFMRLEVRDNYLKLNGLKVSAKISATVYEPGVLFLKVTLFRRLLRSIKGQKFLTIQVTADELLMDNIRFPLDPNDMLVYVDPDQAPQQHPEMAFVKPNPEAKPIDRQMMLWGEKKTEPTGEQPNP